MFSVALLLLLAAGSCVYSIDLIQPDSMVVQPGQSLTITCQVSGYSLTDNSYGTGWIRQHEGRTMDWISHQWGTSGLRQNDVLKNKFSYSRDTSARTVTITGQNVQPEDTAVYYCVRVNGYGAFDYWGKGTMVTVSSASPTTPSPPAVFPLRPCTSGTGDTVTIGCLATEYSPAALTFSWTKGTQALQDFVQYPAVQKGDGKYIGVSQIQVSRQDWENRVAFKCLATHAGGNTPATLQIIGVHYKSPNLTLSSFEDDDKATFSCFAKDYSPQKYEFTWLKNNAPVTTKDDEIIAVSEAKTIPEGKLYSTASFLTVPATEADDATFTCVFKWTGENNTPLVMKRNSTVNKEHCQADGGACPQVDADIKIIGPTVEDMLLKKQGTLTCEANVKQGTFEEMMWEKSGTEVAGSALKVKNGKKGLFASTATITYDEWVSGTEFVCSVKLLDWVAPEKRRYERAVNGGPVERPSVFMLPPVKHTRKDQVTLTCYVKDFYPKEVFVSWLVDDEDAGSKFDFNTTEPIKTGNGLYSAYGQLTIGIDEWEQTDVVYSCAVYHQSVANTTKAIIRSIGYRTFQNTNIVNLDLNVPETCKAQ